MLQKKYFTVGPSELYPTVYKHILKALKRDIPSISHRGSEFKKLYQEVSENLKKLLKIPAKHQIFFTSSALEAFERIIQGCVQSSSLHIITGSFGSSWFKTAQDLAKSPLKEEASAGEGIDLTNLKVPKEAELICITQNDTSTGVWLPPEGIHALKLHYPKKLIAVDVVSSIPYVDLDYSKIDITLFSVQKGFGLPAGLGVMIVSPQALEKAGELLRTGISIGSYHSLINFSKKYSEFLTPETPNVLNIYLMSSVIGDMLKLGIDKIRRQTDQKANLIYKFFERHSDFKPFVKDPKYRSKTSLVVDVLGRAKELKEKLAKKGIIISAGYGDYKENHIRLANFPSQTLSDVRKLLSFI
ncbi:aminotransferase class V-fold PLP-dependent enzyme [Candidatus Daviesbacteria bacterium]|nr:aminotransferase class V-fold PLP-dependent enzyme [Candidatus Daviesbacteria bacterium]